MVNASFTHDGNCGTLNVVCHFGYTRTLECTKQSNETFRLGGTAINAVAYYEGIVLKFNPEATFRAFTSEKDYFEGVGILSNEEWTDADRHCYVVEHYPIDMEGKKPGWFISHQPLKNANHLFVNLDVLDGGGNVVKRYRVSPFTGQFIVMVNIYG